MKPLLTLLTFLVIFTQSAAHADTLCYYSLNEVNATSSNYGLPPLPATLFLWIQPQGTKHVELVDCQDPLHPYTGPKYNISSTMYVSIAGKGYTENVYKNVQSYYVSTGPGTYKIYNHAYFEAFSPN